MNDYLKNLYFVQGLIIWLINRLLFHQVQSIKPIYDPPEHCVFAVQFWAPAVSYEKLTPIRVRPAISHWQNPSTVVFQTIHDLVLKWLPVNTLTTLPCVSWVAALNNEAFNVAVEYGVVILAACCEGQEVFAGVGA